MTSAQISVIIPCYNQAHYLADAIDSVRLQAWPDVQIVVVDDGSTDDTPKVAGRYRDVTLIQQKNAGLSAARNRGLEVSTGDFVVFLDADDRLLHSALIAGFTALQENPDCVFSWGCHQLLEQDGTTVLGRVEIPVAKSSYESFLQTNFVVMHATVMYRKTVLQKCGGFNTSLRSCEDYDLYLRITREHEIVHHSSVIAEYRRHQSNMSYNSPMMLDSALAVLGAQEPFTVGCTRLERARQAGIMRWQEFYGLRAVRRMCGLLVRGRFHEVQDDLERVRKSVGLPALLFNLPAWMFRHLAGKLHSEKQVVDT